MALNLDAIREVANETNETNKEIFLNELKKYDIPSNNNIDDLKSFKSNYSFRYFMILLGFKASNYKIREYYKPLYELYKKGYDEDD